MREFNTLLDNRSNLLFIAPTGWGKTTLLLELMQNSNKSWIYLSPLRALANEFYIRAESLGGVVLIKSAAEARQLLKNGLKFKLLIITPELLSESLLQSFEKDTHFVFDEIHLFMYWGKSFRPKLIESLESILSLEFSTLSLTATMSEDLLSLWKSFTGQMGLSNYVINLGNHRLKKWPCKITYIPNHFKENLLDELTLMKTEHTKLIFCKYRQEVERVKKRLIDEGKIVLSCIGGGTNEFSLELSKYEKPDFIVSTSALSHGVNLPKISVVYISYKVSNFDFWIQMSGRAGRRGERFTLFTHDYEFIPKKQNILSIVYLLLLKLKNMIYPYELRRYFNK